jgi:hypothetical protein
MDDDARGSSHSRSATRLDAHATDMIKQIKHGIIKLIGVIDG